MVVKISGKPVSQPELADALWTELAEAARGQALVIVHGGGVQVDELMARLGEPVERRDGIRLTPSSQMPLVAGVLAGQVNQQIVAMLRRSGARPVGLSLASSGVVAAEIDPRVGGRVGRVVGGDARLLTTLLAEGYLPVVSSIGSAEDGELLNINADDAAAGVARSLGAQTVLMLTDVPGVLDAERRLIEHLLPGVAEELIADGTITGGMVAKVRSALELSESSDTPVLVASWKDARAALNGSSGCGTVIGTSERASARGESA